MLAHWTATFCIWSCTDFIFDRNCFEMLNVSQVIWDILSLKTERVKFILMNFMIWFAISQQCTSRVDVLQCTRKGNVNSVSTTVYQQHLLSSHTGLLTIFAHRTTIFAHRTAIFDYSFTEQLTLLINLRWGLLSLFLKYELGWSVAVSYSLYCRERDGLLFSA